MSKNDSQLQAFPTPKPFRAVIDMPQEPGMSLRDYIAIKIIPTVLDKYDIEKSVKAAYAIADVVIRVRDL